MGERWKYQIKNGGFYALFMSLMFALWECYSLSIEEAFLSKRFLIRLVLFLATGIFLIGYVNWKAKVKNDSKK